jgi:hypothetical protein
MSWVASVTAIFVWLLLALAGGFSLVTVTLAYYCEWVIRPRMERGLGFRRGSACRSAPNFAGYSKAMAVVSIVDGGEFQRAGFRAGDVLPDVSYIGFFMRLWRRRGHAVEFAVVDGGEGPPFEARSRRTIRLVIPPDCDKA